MAKRYPLNTETCIFIIQHKPVHARQRFERIPASNLALSVVTWGELEFGAQGSHSPDQARGALVESRKR